MLFRNSRTMGKELTTDEGLAPAPHRRDCGLAPLSCRLPLKGGVMDGHGLMPATSTGNPHPALCATLSQREKDGSAQGCESGMGREEGINHKKHKRLGERHKGTEAQRHRGGEAPGGARRRVQSAECRVQSSEFRERGRGAVGAN